MEVDKWAELVSPFTADEIKIRILAWSKDRSRGRIVAYIEGNTIRDRLDTMVGYDNWTAKYTAVEAPTATMVCELTIAGITKQNVGTGDDHKAAATDALKRAAMEHGIGRYLAYMPQVWVDLNDKGYMQDGSRTRALILHLLGYDKQSIEQSIATEQKHEQEVRYLLHQFNSGTQKPRERRERKSA